jgi:hypothetical protein
MLRWGLGFLAVAAAGLVAFLVHRAELDRNWTLVDEPLSVSARAAITNVFSVPAKTAYEIDIYVKESVKYADCLLGQIDYDSSRCTRYPRVIDMAWTLRAKDGRILANGLSGGTCCTYTRDEHNKPVVYSVLDVFSVPTDSDVYLELKSNRNDALLTQLDPRLVVERTSGDSESEAVAELFDFVGMALFAAIGAVLLLIFAYGRWRTRPAKST